MGAAADGAGGFENPSDIAAAPLASAGAAVKSPVEGAVWVGLANEKIGAEDSTVDLFWLAGGALVN